MRYGITFGEGSEPTEKITAPKSQRRLLHGASFDTVSSACRGAGLAFMSGVAEGWTKLDLAVWLSGPYAHATRFAPRGERALAPSSLEPNAVDTDRLDDLMQNARIHALALCEELALPRSESDFIDDAIARGLLAQVEDELGHHLWVPIDSRRMRLRDRIRSLFVVDYLLAPHEYLNELLVCHRCEQVVFDLDAKRLGQCSLHRRQSGIVARGNDAATDASKGSANESPAESGYDKETFGQAG